MLDHYPWFLDTYDNLPKPIMKADSVRYLYMHHIGGTPCSCPLPAWVRASRHGGKGDLHTKLYIKQNDMHEVHAALRSTII